MDISYQSLFYFVIITIIYFSFPSIGKPAITLADLTEEGKKSYYAKNMLRLAFYLMVVIISQFSLNTAYLMGKCGGSLDKNIGAAALFTFIPWLFIFGIMITVLLIFPGFKGAFADVIGYYVVSSQANDIFGSLLRGTDLNELIEKTNDLTEKKELTKAAEAILKICGNKSILINQMNTENYLEIWDALKPLMKPDIEPALLKSSQEQLFALVVTKENIGEALWYVYTAILISSIVYYNLATRGCIKNIDQVKADHDAYIQQQEENDQQQQLENSTTYVLD